MAESNMVERVARALDPDIWADDGPIPTRSDVIEFHARRQRSVQLARAAIEAMREPTRAMRDAGCDKGPDTPNGEFSYDDADRVWSAMIDAATRERTE